MVLTKDLKAKEGSIKKKLYLMGGIIMGNDLDKTVALIEKKFGKGSISIASKFKGLEIKRLPTGSFSIDIETFGGYPMGRIIEIYGELSSGKTTIALKAVVEMQKLKKKCVWVDAEGVFHEGWAKTLGVNTDELYIVRAETAERMLDIADAVVRSKDCGLLVIDSVAALMPLTEEEVPMEDPETLGDRARMMNRFMRKLHSALNMREDEVPNECLVILINQTRDKIGAYGNPTTTTGGKGIGFGASIRLEVRRKDWIKEGSGDKEKVVGQTIKFKIAKSKVSPPYRDGEFDFYFDDAYGLKKGEIDRIKEVINYGVFYNIIKQGGSFFSFDTNKFQGREKLYEFFKENPKEAIKIKASIMEIALRNL